MSPTYRDWHGVIAAVTLGLLLGCNDAPGPSGKPGASTDAGITPSVDEGKGEEIPFPALRLFLEFNSSANDMGVQLFLDAEEWKRVVAFDPGGDKILDFLALGRFQQLGLAELVFESAEPTPQEVLALFPEGHYRFIGRTLEGDRLVGTAFLSHAVPPAPTYSPSHGELVDRNNVLMTINPVPGIASFQLIVENDDLHANLTLDLKPSVGSVQVPAAFLQPGTTYKTEVLAIGTNGNRTITEGTFVTKP
jgi:hypothetical protein